MGLEGCMMDHRVVSLLPSGTEVVGVVGGLKFLVGRSHECNFPEKVKALPVLTAAKTAFVNSKQMHHAVVKMLEAGDGLYAVDEDLLKALEPDVIVTQSVCAVCSVDYKLVKRIAEKLPKTPMVIDLNPQSLDDVLESCLTVGAALGLQEEAENAKASMIERVQKVKQYVGQSPLSHPPKVGFLEWTDPIFVGGHWTPQLIHMAGGVHILNPPKGQGGAGASYAITNEAFAESDPDWIIICPCGLDIEETEKEMKSIQDSDWWLSLRAVKEGKLVLVDGDQMFNRPGPRLVDALEWLVGLLHNDPSFMPASFPWKFPAQQNTETLKELQGNQHK